MRLCRKFCRASPASEFDDALELDELDAVLPVFAAALAVEEVVTPADARADSIAVTKPPPGDGGGEVETDAASLDVVWLRCSSNADRIDKELVDPEPVTELTLIGCSW
jgi:hypothetical protein